LAREAVDLSALVSEMSSMLEVSIAKKVRFSRELAPGLPTVLGDATQIRQVVMNLVLNASEAIGDREGNVVISTGVETYSAEALSRSQAGAHPKPGAYVHVEVQDDGAGMDPKTVSQMFEPFFTTKFMGRGLGMAAVLGMVRGHEGAIFVESTPGTGTRVRVMFPASMAPPPKEAPRRDEEARGEGVVLVVDDEKNIRISTQMLLSASGFEVILAADGLEAIKTMRVEGHRVAAVLLDLTMPRMSGVETMNELRRIAPAVPIVLMSGYGAAGLERASAHPEGPMPDAVLPKPYRPAELVATLRSVIRSAR
jgi:two-component system cell cycle sensor histidine kinase/response regulator CckA